MNFIITKQQGKIATHLESPWALPALMEHTVKTKAFTAINENTGWINFYKFKSFAQNFKKMYVFK